MVEKGDTTRTIVVGSLSAIAILLTIGSLLWAMSNYLEHKIKTITNEDEFINKIASRVRPSMIFDDKGAIHVDQGAMQFLEKIEVDHNKGEDIVYINIFPKKHLAYAPLIQALPNNWGGIPTFERGKGHQWLCKYRVVRMDPDFPYRFRLEILN